MYAWILFPCCGGILSGVLLASVWGISIGDLFVPGCMLALCALLLWLRGVFSHLPVATVLFVGAMTVGVVRFEAAQRTFEIASRAIPSETSFMGVVVSEPDVRVSSQRVIVRTEAGQKIVISIDRYAAIEYGDVLRISGRPIEPQSFVADSGRTFEYAGYLRAKGVTHTLSFVTPEIIGSGAGNPIVSKLLKIKSSFLKLITQSLPEPESGLAAGLLLGVKQSLGTDLEHDFQVAGLTHIVVLSGYNIMLVIAFAVYLLAYVLPWRARLVASMSVVILFMLLVGTGPSVVRASVMALLLLSAHLFGRRYDVLRALCVTATGMVLLNPYILQHDIGFQFSVMATFGLVVVAPELEQLLIKVPVLGIRALVTATLAAQIAVLPLMAYHIGVVSIVSVFANVLVLPMVPFAMLGSFVTGLVAALLPILVPIIALPTYLALAYIINVAQATALVPFATVVLPPFSAYWIIPGYVIIGGLWWHLYRMGQIKKVAASTDAATLAFFTTPPDRQRLPN